MKTSMMDFNLVGVGEVLWDLLDSGPQLGGAPANFAYHARALGGDARVITRIGADERGREIQRRFAEMRLPLDSVQIDPSAPTGTASVTLDAAGVAQFAIKEDVAWDHLAATESALALARTADALCFGTLALRSLTSRRTIRQLEAASAQSALRVFDINLREPYYSRHLIEHSLQISNVLKLNEDELDTLATMFDLTGSTESLASTKSQIEKLARMFPQRVVALTRGPKGALLYSDARWSDCPSQPVAVVDTIGAGDAFTAALVLGLLHKMGLDEINALANDVARYVCSQPGAMPPLPGEFAERLRAHP